MKVLLHDVNRIEWELVKPEAVVYERDAPKKQSVGEALVLFVAVERGDTEAFASKAVKEAIEFAQKLKRKTLVVYPYAHLSSDLEQPERAMTLFHYMVKEAENKSGLKVFHSAFGWNKSFVLDVKGHPLAEQYKSYGSGEGAAGKPKKRAYNTALARKVDWGSLPDADHRTIAEKQNLFSFQEVSPGMVYWHNNGFIIYKELVKFIREKLEEYDYQEISTPIMADTALWHISGHIEHYRENMFILEAGDHELGVKPMNCPFAMLVFKSRKRSYRDMPQRYAEFGKLYRNEISGALTGLFRVRELVQDDAHLFVREDQVKQELNSILKLLDDLYKPFGFTQKAKLSTMPDGRMGSDEVWEKATNVLKGVLKENKMKYDLKEKEGSFYGPKIDFDIKDSMGREWQCATVQVDYNMPERFGLSYVGEDGKEHTPVTLHKAIYGSLERFIGVLIEHLQGKFPTWLAPVQVRVITISDPASKYAEKVYAELKKNHIRAELDISDSTLQYKIREGQLSQVPYMIVLGGKEAEAETISVRSRSGKQKMGARLEEFIASLNSEIKERKGELML